MYSKLLQKMGRQQAPSSSFAAMANQRNCLPCTGLLLQLIYTIIVLLLIIDSSVCEYENTWNFYYEQPCCGNSNGHHLRHHRGKYRYIPPHTSHFSLICVFSFRRRMGTFSHIIKISAFMTKILLASSQQHHIIVTKEHEIYEISTSSKCARLRLFSIFVILVVASLKSFHHCCVAFAEFRC